MVSVLMYYLYVLVYIDFLNDFSNVWGLVWIIFWFVTSVELIIVIFNVNNMFLNLDVVWVCIY